MYGSNRTMPPARKCRRTCAPPVPELPVCLLLDIAAIAARTDAATIFRCAATCKLLRREILSADFVHRVCQGPDAVVPSKTLGVLAETFSVVHPVTAATGTVERHFAQVAAGLLERYEPLNSRNGLVVLCQRGLGSERRFADLCVYDPMANTRAFLPFAPDIDRRLHAGVHLIDQCALLTAADGIGCSFMLVAADVARNMDCASSARVRVQTVSWSDTDDAGAWSSWAPVKTIERHPCPWWSTNVDTHNDAAVVGGGVVHCGISTSSYLQEGVIGEYILTYDVNAATVRSVDVPMDRRHPDLQTEPALPSRLASSPDGKLSFVVADRCTVFVWVLSGGGSWARHARIDMRARASAKQELMLLPWVWLDHWVELESFFVDVDRRSGRGAVLLLRFGGVWSGVRFVLDMETGATCSHLG